MSKPQLLIDAHAPGGSGIGRYTFEILRELAAREDFAAIHVAGPPAVLQDWQQSLRAAPTPLHLIALDAPRYSPRVPLQWARIAAAVGAPHVTWFPHWDGAWSASPFVTSIHDLIHLSEPGLRGRAKAAIARAWIGRMVQGSQALLTVSEHSATRIREQFPLAASKLQVVHNGVSEIFFRAAAAAAATATATATASPSSAAPALPSALAGISAPYLLTVGNKRAHKRFETAIRAFARLAPERPDLQLVMVGNRDAHSAALRALATSLNVAARVHDVAALGDQALLAAYANAEALLVTSREEGFGLIAVEAMAAGTPVIFVDRAPFLEVMAHAGIKVPYDDASAMAAAVQRLAHAPLRQEQIKLGRQRAAEFTWAKTAEAVAQVLRAAASAR